MALSKFADEGDLDNLLSSNPREKGRVPRSFMLSELKNIAQNEFRQALEELERKRRIRSAKLIEEAKKRLNEKSGKDLPPFSKSVSYSQYATSFSRHISKMAKKYNEMLYIPRVEDSFGDAAYSLRGYSGDEVLRSLRSVFSRFPEPPTPFQWKIFDAMCCAAKALIYGQEYFSDPGFVLDRNGWTDDNDIVAILTGRKTGKSTGLSMAHLAFMIVISGYRGVNASRTQEQSCIIIDLARQLVRRHPDVRAQGIRLDQVRARYISLVKSDGSESSLEAKCGDGNVCISFLFILQRRRRGIILHFLYL